MTNVEQNVLGGAAHERGAAHGRQPSRPPLVSVVIPCFNEERHIEKVLENFSGQHGGGDFEIIVVDGMSTDGTRAAIARFRESRAGPEVRVVDNPARVIPAALNIGIRAARGEFIVRMDAHAVPPRDYVRRCLGLLSEGGAGIVGMPCRILPGADTAAARAVAAAVAHPFGIGDAQYRVVSPTDARPRDVDTVPFGAFRKELWRELGGYNEGLLTNEDYDFNYRARASGRRVVLDPSGRCDYFARPTLGALAAQYFRYGSWKAQMVKLHPRSLRWRHLVAPAFVAALAACALAAPWLTAARWLLLAIAASYALAALACAAQLAARAGEARLLPLLPPTFFTIHATWGVGFLLGLVRRPRRKT